MQNAAAEAKLERLKEEAAAFKKVNFIRVRLAYRRPHRLPIP
jgi:hypothetical protein